MERSTTVTVGLLFVAGVAAAAVLALRPKHASEHAPSPKASVSAVASAKAAPSSSTGAAAPADADLDAGVVRDGVVTEGFETFPDGGKVPELPASAPTRVGFGAVVFAYQGAQGAPRDARSK